MGKPFGRPAHYLTPAMVRRAALECRAGLGVACQGRARPDFGRCPGTFRAKKSRVDQSFQGTILHTEGLGQTIRRFYTFSLYPSLPSLPFPPQPFPSLPFPPPSLPPPPAPSAPFGMAQQKAFDVHWDPQESVLSFIVAAKKRWQVCLPPTRPQPFEKKDIEAAAENPPGSRRMGKASLRDGDTLYNPRAGPVACGRSDERAEPSHLDGVSLTPPDRAGFSQLNELRGCGGPIHARNTRQPVPLGGRRFRPRPRSQNFPAAVGARLAKKKNICDFWVTGTPISGGAHPISGLPNAAYEQLSAVTDGGGCPLAVASLHRLPQFRQGGAF